MCFEVEMQWSIVCSMWVAADSSFKHVKQLVGKNTNGINNLDLFNPSYVFSFVGSHL